MLSLLRRIKDKFVYMLGSDKAAGKQSILEKARELDWQIFHKGRSSYQFKKENLVFTLRCVNSSDLNVFSQVFIDQEYAVVKNYFIEQKLTLNTMIDAGANVGLTSLYFKSFFPDVKIACIEPDVSNYKLLSINLNGEVNNKTVRLFQNGLMGKSGLHLTVGDDFRGGSDWAKQVIVSQQQTRLKSITIDDICKVCDFESIDLLKMDIEGAETFLLEKDTDTSFLKNTKVFALEIHDEYNCRLAIYDLLIANGFTYKEYGETTLAINQRFL